MLSKPELKVLKLHFNTITHSFLKPPVPLLKCCYLYSCLPFVAVDDVLLNVETLLQKEAMLCKGDLLS